MEVGMPLDVRHAFDPQKKSICGEGKYGFETIDSVTMLAITCPACLRIIAEAAINKLRRLGTNMTPESEHHCAASIMLKIERDSLLQQVQQLREESQRHTNGRMVAYERSRRDFDVAVQDIKAKNQLLELENRQLKEENGILKTAHAVAVQGPGARAARVGVALEVTQPVMTRRPAAQAATPAVSRPQPQAVPPVVAPRPPAPPSSPPQRAVEDDDDAASRRFKLLEID